MKKKKLSWSQLIREIKEANKDPEFVLAVKDFINKTSGRRVYKV